MMNQVVMQALEIMWKGMLGIFVALVVIMIFVWIKPNNEVQR